MTQPRGPTQTHPPPGWGYHSPAVLALRGLATIVNIIYKTCKHPEFKLSGNLQFSFSGNIQFCYILAMYSFAQSGDIQFQHSLPKYNLNFLETSESTKVSVW